MKKTIIIIALVLTACSPVITRDAIGLPIEATPSTVILQPGESVQVNCPQPLTVDGAPNALVLGCPENTPVPPTETPIANIEPYPDAPECAIHPAGYHALWNAAEGCHYTHTHGDNVADIQAFFNMTYADLYGQELGFPWSPEKEDIGQNHNGYRYWFSPELLPAHAQEQYKYRGDTMAFINAVAIEIHDNNGVARKHSFAMWVQTESRDGVIGYAFIGGMADSGCAHIPYKKDVVQMPDDPVDASGNSLCVEGDFKVPYRGLATQSEALNSPDGRNKWIWDFDNFNDARRVSIEDSYGRLGFFNMRTFKSFGWVDPNDYNTRHNLCDSPVGCEYANTDMQVFNIMLDVPEYLDDNGDGLVTFTGFSDLRGEISDTCTEVGPECVPVIFDNVPVGYSNFSRAGGQIFTDYPLTHEWNIYFDGVPSGWVELPPVE